MEHTHTLTHTHKHSFFLSLCLFFPVSLSVTHPHTHPHLELHSGLWSYQDNTKDLFEAFPLVFICSRTCCGKIPATFPFILSVYHLPLGGSDHLLCLPRSWLQNLQKENEWVFPHGWVQLFVSFGIEDRRSEGITYLHVHWELNNFPNFYHLSRPQSFLSTCINFSEAKEVTGDLGSKSLCPGRSLYCLTEISTPSGSLFFTSKVRAQPKWPLKTFFGPELHALFQLVIIAVLLPTWIIGNCKNPFIFVVGVEIVLAFLPYSIQFSLPKLQWLLQHFLAQSEEPVTLFDTSFLTLGETLALLKNLE